MPRAYAALLILAVLAFAPAKYAMAQGNSGNGDAFDRGPNGGPPGNDNPGNDQRNHGGGDDHGGGGGDDEGGDDDGGSQSTVPGDTPPPSTGPTGNEGSGNGTIASEQPDTTGSDSERALDAVRDHRAMPLEDILKVAGETHPGRLIDAELISVGNFLLYELKLIQPDGDVETVYYYARSGIEVRDD